MASEMSPTQLARPRPPSLPQTFPQFNESEIRFLHPGYECPMPVLFTLPRVDCETFEGTIVYGIHHKTALTACQIVAGNVFDAGHLALDRTGLQRVTTSLDGLLTEDSYYFVVDGNDKYPVVPSFRSWIFPHRLVSNIWPFRLARGNSSSHCCITGSSYAVNGAHLVPRDEMQWYGENCMSVYGGDINDPANILPVRKDLHKCFDDRWFAIVPKMTSDGTQFVTHILSKDAAELWPTYHNITIQHPSNRNYLFARFAWAIFQQVKLFIIQGGKREIIRLQLDTDTGAINYKQESMSGPQLQNLFGGGGSRSATPMKRRLGTVSEELEGKFSEELEGKFSEELEGNFSEELEGNFSEGSLRDDNVDMDADQFWEANISEDEPGKAAKRRQQSSSDTIVDTTWPEDLYGKAGSSATEADAFQDVRETIE
ncbi:hypothetical protein TsFJ059_005279 [Trichoderma semiorbis]|uniref:HNH nuclease domain-containing protein n=1 Tax=Trichoderma semiorbis TaxID=1491008 RepID=A0A9P8KXF6_9HYPO|nr:hypothetical protein TsFJ059_005279 [Trichoderma semiorbis]